MGCAWVKPIGPERRGRPPAKVHPSPSWTPCSHGSPCGSTRTGGCARDAGQGSPRPRGAGAVSSLFGGAQATVSAEMQRSQSGHVWNATPSGAVKMRPRGVCRSQLRQGRGGKRVHSGRDCQGTQWVSGPCGREMHRERSRQALVPERRRVCELQKWEAQESNGRVSTGNGVHDATDSRVEQGLEVGPVSQPETTRGNKSRGDAGGSCSRGEGSEG